MIVDHFGCLNKWNKPILSPLQAILVPTKSQNAFKMACFVTEKGSKWVKNVFFEKRS